MKNSSVSRCGARLAVLAVAASLLSVVAPSPSGAVSPDVVISQVYGGGGNSGATLTNDFIELYNRGASPVSLDGWSVQYASSTGSFTQVTSLTGTLDAGEHYLVEEAAGAAGSTPLPEPDATGTIAMSATSGKVALVTSTAALNCGVSTTPCGPSHLASVRDLVGYGLANLAETSPTPALSNTTAALRAADGATDTDNNAADFTVGTPNPRNRGTDPPPPSGCDVPATFQIGAVQGTGAASPFAGQQVRIEGVVTGDFQAAGQLGGFFAQDDTPDDNALTSDGIFVFTSLPAQLGDRVLVSGTVVEFNGLTELSPVTAVDVCGTGSVSPMTYDLPRPEGVTFEPVEGVLVTFPETLTATEHFQLGRFGEITVSSDGRLFQATDRVEPGAPAQARLAENLRRRLLIDDGSNVQNPATVPFLSPDAVRIGDTTSGVTGVMHFGFGLYRLEPTQPIAFSRTNPRPAAPAPVGGDVQVASFNALNYFTTIDGPDNDARGADSAEEFQRQQAKVVAAILGIDADVIGLMEIENNGSTAIANLVDALNAATAPGTYAYITEPSINPPNAFGGTFGTDAIKVSIIYRPAVVSPLGLAQTSTDPVFDRPPLIQTFQLATGSEPFTVAVNHFKSKNCGPGGPGDADLGDGQSCFNARRVLQATTLANVLDTLDVPNPLIIGDLNAYTEEDPIHALEAAGYTGLSELFVPEAQRYSFVFDGYSGELDHAMASAELLDNVTGTTIWHINADEPLILDYNTEFNPDGLYVADAYRSSDHDPLILGLDLAPVFGSVVVNKTGVGGAPLGGAGFTLYVDAAPTGGSRGAEDTAAAGTCSTDGAGTCTITQVGLGDYWLVETGTPNGYSTASPQPVNIALGTVPGSGETEVVNVGNVAVPGTVVVEKAGKGRAQVVGVTFTLYVDAAPSGTGVGPEDTAVAGSCLTALVGTTATCSITSVPLGQYWLVESEVPGTSTDGPVAVEVGLGPSPNVGDTDVVVVTNKPKGSPKPR